MKTNLNGAALSRRTLLAGSAVVATVPTLDAFSATVSLFEAEARAVLGKQPDVIGLVHPVAEIDPVIAMCQRWRELDRERGAAYEYAGQRIDDLRQAGWKDADIEDDPEYVARWAEFDRIDATADSLDRKIRAMPAQSLAGILAKLECWVVDSDPGPANNTDHGFAVSALGDARRLCDPAAFATVAA